MLECGSFRHCRRFRSAFSVCKLADAIGSARVEAFDAGITGPKSSL
jgi:hypothetical protein